MQSRTFPAVGVASRKTLGRLFIAAISGFFIILFISPSLYAQSEIKILGQVIDAVSGAPIPGASVTIEGLGRSVVSDASGRFRFTDLPVGDCLLSARRIGYRLPSPVPARIDPASESQLTIRMIPSPIQTPNQLVIADAPGDVVIRREGNRTIVQIVPGAGARLEELIEKIPELEIVESGAQRFLRIRGADLKGTTVMLDGRIINSTLTSKADISAVPSGSVKQMEIITGGSSSAGGLAGSINFITGDPGGSRRISAAAGRGSFGMESYALHTGGYDLAGMNVAAEAVNSLYRGDFGFVDPRDSAQTRLNNFSRTNKLFCSVGLPSSAAAITLKARYFRRKAGVPGPIFQLTPEAESDAEEEEIYASLSRRFRNSLDLNLLAGITKRRADYVSPRTATNFIPYSTRFEELSRDVRVEFHRIGQLDIAGHLDVRYESLEGSDFIRPASALGFHSRLVDVQGLGASCRLPAVGQFLESSTATIGLRREGGNQGFFLAPSATYRLNLNLPGRPGMDVSFSRERRLPDLADLYWKEDVFATPNPDLRPEKSENLEAGLDGSISGPAQIELRVSRYSSEYEDLIIWRKWAGDKFKPVNLSRARISGWDIYVESRPFHGPIKLHWSASLISPLNKESEPSHHDKFLTFRPIGLQKAAVEFEFKRIKAKVSGRHYGRRYTTEENTKSLGPVDLIDLELAFTLRYKTMGVEINGAVNNMGDIQYEILDRQPEKPREYRVSIEIIHKGGSNE